MPVSAFAVLIAFHVFVAHNGKKILIKHNVDDYFRDPKKVKALNPRLREYLLNEKLKKIMKLGIPDREKESRIIEVEAFISQFAPPFYRNLSNPECLYEHDWEQRGEYRFCKRCSERA